MADHIEKAWLEFLGFHGLAATPELRRAFFTGAYAAYVLAVTLSGTASVEEGARVMTELSDEFDRYLRSQHGVGGPGSGGSSTGT